MRSGSQVAVVDLKVNLPIKYIDVGKGPIGIAINKRNSLALAANSDSGSNCLSVINTGIAGASPDTIAAGSNPIDVILSPHGNTAYVSNSNDNNIGVVDVFSHQQTAAIPVGSYPYGLALTGDGRFLVASNCYSHTVSIIDPRFLEVIATVAVNENPQYIAILN